MKLQISAKNDQVTRPSYTKISLAICPTHVSFYLITMATSNNPVNRSYPIRVRSDRIGSGHGFSNIAWAWSQRPINRSLGVVRWRMSDWSPGGHVTV